jgi:hypothetical protein
MKKYTVLLLLLFSCSIYDKNEIEPVSHEEYAIYSAIIDSLYRHVQNITVEKNTIAFYEKGPPYGFFTPITRKLQMQNKIDNSLELFNSSRYVRNEFLCRSKLIHSFDIEDLINQLLIKNTFSFNLNRTYFRCDNIDSVQAFSEFRQEKGCSSLIIGFSRAGLNHKSNQAVLYMMVWSSPMSARSNYVLLNKKQGNWIIIDMFGGLVT